MHLITSHALITNIARELLVGSALQILSSSEFMAPSSDSEAAYQPQTIKIIPLCLTAVSAFVKCFLISVLENTSRPDLLMFWLSLFQ